MYRLLACLCSVMIASTNIVAAAIPYPYLPYVPPTDSQVWDMVFNAFGVTAPEIEDAEKKLTAYWDLYRLVMGSAFDEFQDDMQEVIDKAKTARKIEISASTRAPLVKGMKKAISDGMTYTTGGTVISQYADYIPLLHQAGVTRITATDLENNAARNGVASGQVGKVFLYTVDSYGLKYNVFVLPQGAQVGIATIDGVRTLSFTGVVTTPVIAWRYVVNNDTIYQNEQFQNPTQYISNNTSVVQVGGATTATATVAAKNNAVRASIFDEIASVLTAATELIGSVVDDTKPIVIRLPITIPTPATDVSDLDDVEDELNVVPSADTADVAETVAELQETEQARYGDTTEYSVDLTDYFPFCIPFDIYKVLQLFGADPEAPNVEFSLPTGYDATNHEFVFSTFNLDLSPFDAVAYWVRQGEKLAFIVGLGIITREKFLRG